MKYNYMKIKNIYDLYTHSFFASVFSSGSEIIKLTIFMSFFEAARVKRVHHSHLAHPLHALHSAHKIESSMIFWVGVRAIGTLTVLAKFTAYLKLLKSFYKIKLLIWSFLKIFFGLWNLPKDVYSSIVVRRHIWGILGIPQWGDKTHIRACCN